ncbi:hypothetical protein TMatcc_005683 [Talaromyces marneffei ATCC 18224]
MGQSILRFSFCTVHTAPCSLYCLLISSLSSILSLSFTPYLGYYSIVFSGSVSCDR